MLVVLVADLSRSWFVLYAFVLISSAQREITNTREIQNIFSFSENKKHLFTCKAATGIGEKVTYS